jgi:hypothetical protein
VVQVHHHKGRIAGGIGEAEDAGKPAGGHFGLYAVIQELYAVITRRGGFLFVGEAGTVSAVGILVRSGGGADGTGPGHKEEVSQVRNARSAEVGEAEAHNRGLAVFVAGGDIVIIVIGVGADLDAAEGNLGAGIHIPETIGADKGVYITDKPLLCIQTDGQEAGEQGKQLIHLE